MRQFIEIQHYIRHRVELIHASDDDDSECMYDICMS